MSVGLKLGSITDEIGSPDFFHAFFSTISANLEFSGWGSRFPVIMDKLYAGELPQDYAIEAIAELKEIKTELSKIGPEKVVWDIEDKGKSPPWGKDLYQMLLAVEMRCGRKEYRIL